MVESRTRDFAGVGGYASIRRKFYVFGLVASVCVAFAVYRRLRSSPPVPALDENARFGPVGPETADFTIRPFEIRISDKVITDLNERLDRYLEKNVTSPLRDQAFRYGFNSDYLREVIRYWRNDYKWSRRETLLNRYPQYKTEINGLDIHYIHVKPVPTKEAEVLPVLLLHGWPSSVREFLNAIPALAKARPDANFVFELVVPSLPGFGFSDRATEPGLGAAETSVIMKKLMNRVGFEKFYVQGGDWGAVIAKNLGILYPESVLGIHSNMCFVLSCGMVARWMLGAVYSPFAVERNFYGKLYPAVDKIKFVLEEFGYLHLQATKPDTIGIALEDSPAGLAAYVLEKFSIWTNPEWRSLPDGGLTRKYSLDELLDNVMIYWVTNSIMSSMRLYKETMSDRHLSLRLEEIPIEVPTVCTRYEHEIFWMSRQLIQNIFRNIVQLVDIEDGGHYPAFEKPKEFAEDVWNAFEVLLRNQR